ncbi:17074_t:CDS:2, partial [Funneliformis geosporum]
MQRHKQNGMAELKYRRLVELNQRLREDLDRPRVRVSEASTRIIKQFNNLRLTILHGNVTFYSLIRYCKNTRDFLVPSVWGPVDKRDDPYAPSG